jgi:hypothetical protein
MCIRTGRFMVFALLCLALPVTIREGFGQSHTCEIPNNCACLSPPTTINCTQLGMAKCNGQGQVKTNKDWCCTSDAGDNWICGRGTSPANDALCYTDYDCVWVAGVGCQFNQNSAVPHNDTLMIIKGPC